MQIKRNLYHCIKTLIKNVILLNFAYEFLMSFWSTIYNTDANVVNGLKNSSSYEPTGENSLEIDEVYAEKIKVKVYASQQNSVS